AARNIARVLLVTWNVSDRERTRRRCKRAPGDVDRDTLLALSFEAVHQQGKVVIVARGAVSPRIARKLREMVFEHQGAVVKEPAHQGRLAVIDRATGHEPQAILLPCRPNGGRITGVERLVHQK